MFNFFPYQTIPQERVVVVLQSGRVEYAPYFDVGCRSDGIGSGTRKNWIKPGLSTFIKNLAHMSSSNFWVTTDFIVHHYFKTLKSLISRSCNTVIPRFTRLLWQPKNRVNRNSCYTSHSIEKKCFKKCQKNFY